jgi:predicted nuclease of predicted toxin-antitoxin system
MKFKIDENLPREVAELLIRAGHDAITAAEQSLGGSGDRELISACSGESRILITLDADFADIRSYPPKLHPGIIVFRLRLQDKPGVLRTAERLVSALALDDPRGRLWIVSETSIRVRE